MKTIAMIAAAVAVLSTSSAANAGSWIKIERPCGSRCAAPQPAAQLQPSKFYANCCAVGTVRFRDLTNDGAKYVGQSRMTIETNINGTTSVSTIDSTHRFYR